MGNNKLTEDKKIAIQNDIENLGKEETLAKALREQGVSEEDIKKVLDNENVQKLFVEYEYSIREERENNNQQLENIPLENIKSNTLPDIKVEGKDLQYYIVGLAQGINELVNLVGENNATAGIFITQVLLQGAVGTVKGVVGDEIKNQFTQGAKDSLSEIIADKYFGINEESWNTNQKSAITNISDLSSGFAIDTFLSGGAFGIIKGASKLGKASDGLVDSPVFNNSTNTINKTEIPSLKFGENDLVYGPSANGKLVEFKNQTNTKILSDFIEDYNNINGKNAMYIKTGGDWNQISKIAMDSQLEKNRKIHFDLTYMDNIEGVLNGKNYPNATTTFELQYLKQNWNKFKNNVKFYQNGKEVKAPW